jgi:hypothetical protein
MTVTCRAYRGVRWQAVLVAILALMAAATGCDRAWEAYDRVPLGVSTIGVGLDSLRWSDLPSEAQECALGKAFAEGFRTAVPLGVAFNRMAYLEQHHRVVGRLYTHCDSSFLMLAGLTTTRRVVEVEVPPEWFVEPPDDWDPEKEWGNAPYIAYQIGCQTAPYNPSLQKDYSAAESGEAAIEFALHNLKIQPASEYSEGTGKPNAGRYFLACWLVLEGMHDNLNSRTEIGFSTALVERPKLFRGVTEVGYDCRWHDDLQVPGVLVSREWRLRNLGDRRIRLEMSEFNFGAPVTVMGFWVWLSTCMQTFVGHGAGEIWVP